MIIVLVDTDDATTAKDAARETEEEPIELIWGSHMMKKTVDPIISKVKMKCLHYGIAAASDSTKLARHAAKKRVGGMIACAADH